MYKHENTSYIFLIKIVKKYLKLVKIVKNKRFFVKKLQGDYKS